MTTITHFPLPRNLQPATPFISSVVKDDSSCMRPLFSKSKFREILGRWESIQQRLPQLQTEVTTFAIDHFIALDCQLTVLNHSDKQTAAPKFNKDL